MSLAQEQLQIQLDDKYTLESGRVFLTGIQALVRLPLVQRRLDVAKGRDTAGYVSGYRGSPLGGFDQQLWRAQSHLAEHKVVFNPGLNEDLAATALWGTQQAELSGEGAYDGVFGMWYGKGPGVDRSGDVLRHANLAGTSALGGVLALLGDDHTCESSTTAHQSEFAMVDAMIPVLNPAGVQEILDFGLLGWAMSRFSGCWVALKCVHDTVESSASVYVDPKRVQVRLPLDFEPPPGGLNIRWPDAPQAQELRLHHHKLAAVKAFVRANQLNRVVFDSPRARVGVITTGKSYLDVRQALDDLDIDSARAAEIGLRLYKVGMPWPLEPMGLREFCRDLTHVVVVEEKRALIESQLKELMYGVHGAPAVEGKRSLTGELQLPTVDRLNSNQIAVVIGKALLRRPRDARLGRVASRVAELEALLARPASSAPMERRAYFCAGCPHNRSTVVPEGSRALSGIGCHFMAQWMDRDTAKYTQMGGEGAGWIGEAPFSKRDHVFQNMGDGTYLHSGLLAIRAAVAANTNITFKILYNDAVAMTGGQGMDVALDAAAITRQVHAESVAQIRVVTDDPDQYPSRAGFAPGVTVHHRDQLDEVQRELREVPGVSVLVYDQTCAAEKRRRRKRGRYPDPPKRVFINERVCEGCGDCGLTSNCVAISPLETELGRKRVIDQSACNKDYSCLKGFCPSFVTVHGGELRRAVTAQQGAGPMPGESASASAPEPELPEPRVAPLESPYGMVVTGVGGTGVVTIGALIGMAAHLEGKGCSVLDMMGLAQKGGAVTSHLRVGARPEAITATRIADGGASLLLGCDMVAAAAADAIGTARQGKTKVLVNTQQTMPGEFTRHSDLLFPAAGLKRGIEAAAGREQVSYLDASRIAQTLFGDNIAANLMMLGFAVQKGCLPVSVAALERAIELNGVAVKMNKDALRFGRMAAHDRDYLERALNQVASGRDARNTAPGSSTPAPPTPTLEAQIDSRAGYLERYQNAAYANRYRERVAAVRAAEQVKSKGRSGLAEAVAEGYFKLMAYKDEYEVARLYTDGEFKAAIASQFSGDYRLEFHLAPPLLARKNKKGQPLKSRYGQWMMPVFRLLARGKVLRGTLWDPFGYTAERKRERALVREYEALMDELVARLSGDNHTLAVEIASLPEAIRGYGHVKHAHIERAKAREQALLATFRAEALHPEAA